MVGGGGAQNRHDNAMNLARPIERRGGEVGGIGLVKRRVRACDRRCIEGIRGYVPECARSVLEATF